MAAGNVIPSPQDPGVYYVGGQTWQVGDRYVLQKVLGSGSFSCVCLALDKLTNERVALKRVGDVFSSLDYAKRMLREVCILRRLDHPNIIKLLDVFMKPSPTGKFKYRGGRFVPTSYDIYLALEYCDQGDLFNLRGQLPEPEVRSLMWQLLQALRYIHGLNVWHRDVKSANVLMTLHQGRRVAKLADLGSARSAVEDGPPPLEPDALPAGGHAAQGAGPLRVGRQSIDDRMDADDADDTRDKCAACGGSTNSLSGLLAGGGTAAPAQHPAPVVPPNMPRAPAPAAHQHRHHHHHHGDADGERPAQRQRTPEAPGAGCGFAPPLTRLVCTPCYRAPEVIMSRGGYSSAIDMWGLGCILGELLQRVAWLGKASTPHLQIAPVFAVSGKPLTPQSGEHYSQMAQRIEELDALFDVIGTPAWACIEGVQSRPWRRYLYHIPGRAPTLYRRFGVAGEVPVDLLARLLTFDPARRCSAEEAQAHEYFEPQQGGLATAPPEGMMAAASLDQLVVEGVQKGLMPWAVGDGSSGGGGAPAGASGAGCDFGSGMEVDAADGGEARRAGRRPSSTAAGHDGPLRFWEIEEPALALKALEAELATILGPEPDPYSATGTPGAAGHGHSAAATAASLAQSALDEATERLRHMLEHECAEHAAKAAARRSQLEREAAAAAEAAASAAAEASLERGSREATGMDGVQCSPGTPMAGQGDDLAAAASGGSGPSAGGAGHAWFQGWQGPSTGGFGLPRRGSAEALLPVDSSLPVALGVGHLRPDPGQHRDPSLVGYERIPYHADAAAAALEPEKHLSAGRHGEWTPSSLAATAAQWRRTGALAGAGTWGVTLLPPGMEEGSVDKAYTDAIRAQHAR